MPSLIELPTVVSSVISDRMLLVVQIIKAPTEISDLLVAVLKLSDQGVQPQVVIIRYSPPVSICVLYLLYIIACPILLVIQLQKMYGINASVILIKMASVLVLDLHGGFKILNSKVRPSVIMLNPHIVSTTKKASSVIS
eukprot:15326952-Heterocapsa_arctica.AAC.1